MQVRRTDKLRREAQYHHLKEYMDHVVDYYRQLERVQGPIMIKRVYIASDDSTVFKEAVHEYPQFKFLFDDGVSKLAGDYRHRYSESSLQGLIQDIFHLSETDFIVCTFSSQVCRMAYELMQTRHVDASGAFRSLDDRWYFGGGRAELLIVVEKHEPEVSGALLGTWT